MVMKKLEINAINQVDDFMSQYQIWKDHDNFYNQNSNVVDIQKSTNGIPCFHYRNIEAVNQCSSPLIAIDCLTEGKHSTNFFCQYNTDKHYIIFANESHCDPVDLNLAISYTWISHYLFLFLMADTYNTPWKFCFYIDKSYKFDYPKPMRFVSTTGTVRPTRTYLKNQIVEKIKYKNFIFRYSGVDYGAEADLFDMVSFEANTFNPYKSLLEKYDHNVGQTVPINMYNQAYFNLVIETDIEYKYGFLLSEKTIKCLITGMPFVLVATPHFLKHLKELGFHTYHELWDESYDDELDHIKRIDKAIDLCNNLDSFDWAANQSALELIGLKNRCNFLNLNQVISKSFQQFEQAILELAE
jgi:hypothetical protein